MRGGHRWASAPHSSMIAMRADLAAEYPIRIGGVGKDDRDQDHSADQQESLARGRRRRLPYRDRAWHDIRIETDAEPGIGQDEKPQRGEEWPVLVAPRKRVE